MNQASGQAMGRSFFGHKDKDVVCCCSEVRLIRH